MGVLSMLLIDIGLTNSDLDAIALEDVEQLKKRGKQRHSVDEWMLIASEEVGEAAKAILEGRNNKGKLEEVEKECIQAATLYLKIAAMVRRYREHLIT